ncbi:MAG: DUF1638 domain-containing protein [Armatimonadetes bacterium]|nr:DUF1638 domain-containing protein [Armatimonadota bacterium]
MPLSSDPRVVCVACSAFQPELEWWHARTGSAWSVRYLDSALHMHPERLIAAIAVEVKSALAEGARVVVLFGDCAGEHPGEHDPRVHVVPCENCAEAFAGPEGYQQLIREHACALLPEWARRWREVLADIPGLGVDLTAELIRDSHRALVYLDTGTDAAPLAEIQDCAAHFGLPCEVREVSLDRFVVLLDAASAALEGP